VTETGHLGVKLFADGADVGSIIELADNPRIAGFTTNPTLMRKAGVGDPTGEDRHDGLRALSQ
jgi:transaldolase